MFCSRCGKRFKGLFIYYINEKEVCYNCFMSHYEYYDTDMAYENSKKVWRGVHFSESDLKLRRDLNKAIINKKFGKLVN
jgi:hypothetical protein